MYEYKFLQARVKKKVVLNLDNAPTVGMGFVPIQQLCWGMNENFSSVNVLVYLF